MNRNQRIAIHIGMGVIISAVLFQFPPIAQDPQYHDLSDQRVIAGIPHFGDVVTNAAFLIVGILGLWQLYQIRENRSRLQNIQEVYPLVVAFSGTVLIFAGSAYYHWAPSNDTLLWDRLPMSIAFMGVFSMILAERINLKAGIILLGPLLIAGGGSVVYWHLSEQAGQGDLRPYILVQFLPLVLIPMTIWLFPARYTGARYILEMVGWYLFAKVFEFLDATIWEATAGVVSGHTLKHLLSAWGVYALVRYLKHRRCLSNGVTTV